MAAPALDLVCLGRVNVDLYAEQEGAPLEDVRSFRKYVGGSAGNICFGTARLGLRSAMVSRVGDEQMGAFVRDELAAAGADVSRLRSDPERLTGLITVAVRESDGFPRIFFYENTADMATDETDIDPAHIASARALLITGTFLSRANLEAATKKAVGAAKAAGRRVVLDVDYRPVLWGVAGHSQGGEMAAPSRAATTAVQSVLPDCDLIVGTEEEIRLAGGSDDTRAAAARIRELSSAAIVVKVGRRGCLILDGPAPDDLEDGTLVPGTPVEVFNSTGAGDAFMSGFLRGWLRGEPLERCAQLGNASGALVVSRHGCAPAIPSWEELEHFMGRAGGLTRPAEDDWLAHLHNVAGRRGELRELCVLAADHRWQLEEAAAESGASPDAISGLKRLIVGAFLDIAPGRDCAGVLLDDRYGGGLFEDLTGAGVWVGRAVEEAKSIPFRFEGGPDVESTMRPWPTDHVAKVMVYAHPDDAEATRASQARRLRRLAGACRSQGRELLVELQAPPGERYGPGGAAPMLEWVYSAGVRPDLWKLPPSPEPAAWRAVGEVICENDPHCRGALVLGGASSKAGLEKAMAAAAAEPAVMGFAVGRAVFAEPAARWFGGEIDDDALAAAVSRAYMGLVGAWHGLRGGR